MDRETGSRLITARDFFLVSGFKLMMLGIVLLMQIGLSYTMRTTVSDIEQAIQEDEVRDNQRFDTVEKELTFLRQYVEKREADLYLEEKK